MYLDLKALSTFSSCSVRWLRDRLVDPFYPLPHYRVEGKLLVKSEEFDTWIAQYRVASSSILDRVVNDVVKEFRPRSA
jgi:hypothetical protein